MRYEICTIPVIIPPNLSTIWHTLCVHVSAAACRGAHLKDGAGQCERSVRQQLLVLLRTGKLHKLLLGARSWRRLQQKERERGDYWNLIESSLPRVNKTIQTLTNQSHLRSHVRHLCTLGLLQKAFKAARSDEN